MDDSSATAKGCLVAGVCGILVLAWQWLDVYFAIGEVPTPTHGQIIRFRVTAALTIGAVLAVPTLDLHRDPHPQPAGPGGDPCFSGTACDAAG